MPNLAPIGRVEGSIPAAAPQRPGGPANCAEVSR